MSIQEAYRKFQDTPFPPDLSDNERLVDILFDLRMYDDYAAGTLDKYLSGRQVDTPELEYDISIENRLNEFINESNNSSEDVFAAVQYLEYLIKIKEVFEKID